MDYLILLATSLKTLQAFDPNVQGKPIDLSKTWTNDFVKKALANLVIENYRIEKVTSQGHGA